MSAYARHLKGPDKVAISIGPRRILASWDDAAELLAELQVLFHEICVNDPDEVSADGD